MRLLLAALVMFSIPLTVFGHSQTPSSYGGKDNLMEAISVQDQKTVMFTITNISRNADRYDITVDGKKVDQTRLLSPGSQQRVGVVFETIEFNKPIVYEVCSVSSVKGGVRTKVCSRVGLVRL